jgi:hypothetical protein
MQATLIVRQAAAISGVQKLRGAVGRICSMGLAWQSSSVTRVTDQRGTEL